MAQSGKQDKANQYSPGSPICFAFPHLPTSNRTVTSWSEFLATSCESYVANDIF